MLRSMVLRRCGIYWGVVISLLYSFYPWNSYAQPSTEPSLVSEKRSFSTKSLSLGLGMADQGDDVPRSALSLEGQWESLLATYHLFGRSFGPVTERQQLLSVAVQKHLFGTLPVTGRLGGSFLKESTRLHAQSENSYALGVLLGVSLHHNLPGSLRLALNWDSHLYPAGLNGGILLASGRKQIINTVIGYQW